MSKEQKDDISRFRMMFKYASDDFVNATSNDLMHKDLARLTMGVYETGLAMCERLDRVIELLEKKT